MSTLVSKNVQIGEDGTASNNFTAYQPAAPDGTLRIGNGNSGSVTDAITLTSAGSVGIGTSAPADKLSVVGTTNREYVRVESTFSSSGSEAGIRLKTAGTNGKEYLIFSDNTEGSLRIYDATAASERMRIDSAGKVGINMTSPIANLSVRGGASNASDLATAYSLAAFNITPKSTSGYSLQFGSGPSDFPYIQMSAGGAASGNLLIQPYGGNVGIGTISPTYKVDVSGTGRFTGSLSVLTGATDTAGLIVGADATVANTWTIARDSISTGDLKFIGNTTERMRITSAGSVGIGITAPTGKFEVSGGRSWFTGNNELYSLAVRYGAGTGTMYIGATNSATPSMQFSNGGGGALVNIDWSGNVGIGTSSPSYKLHVSGSNLYLVNSGNTELMTTNTNGSVTGGIQALSSQSIRFGSITNWPTEFVVNNVPHASLDSSGTFRFNSGYGSVATAYGCRAWVNFNGQGTVSIRASGNVSSVTDNGTGDYTVNFSIGMPDANYSIVLTAGYTTNGGNPSFGVANRIGSTGNEEAPTISSFRLNVDNTTGNVNDSKYVYAAVFR